ncbi:MAG TPA: patatin-like phospholipase family protein [Anaeromyxobacteraceae bacterium]|nr:patatin-like phospholipase family protein [Anaeromyxobacteraceae bacterium]
MNGTLLLVASALIGATTPARTDLRSTARERASAISVTVSGGVSLGAYEAGFLAYAIAATHRREAAEPRLLTGASAGSLNALLAALAACRTEDAASPEETLFWKTWIPIGFEQLFTEKPTPLGAFSRDWLQREAAEVEQVWNRGIDRSCDVVLGVSTTRIEPRMVRTAGGRLELPRMQEQFVIRLQGRGPGRPPRASNYVAPGGPIARPLLVTDERGEIAFSELRDLLFASMAFPVAFAPQPLRSCIAGETSSPGVCLAAEATIAAYLDGGIFDNAPLRMAVGIARAGLAPADGDPRRLEWRSVPDAPAASAPDGLDFAYVNPDAAEYPSRHAERKVEDPSLVGELEGLAGALIDTARSKELDTLVEEHPDIADRLLLPRRQFPAASAPLFAFLGFFESQFRVFDFHLGMYDARRVLMDPGSVAERARGDSIPISDVFGGERFACMRAVYERDADAETWCSGEALTDFRALLQVSLDQLYDVCRTAPPPDGGWANEHCTRAAEGASPPHVPGLLMPLPSEWRRRADEADLAYSMRLLAAYGFRFEDLGVPPGRGDLAVARIRGAIERAGERLASAQPPLHRPAAAFAAKLAADSVAYAPPLWTLHLSMGPTESEVGVSFGIARSPWRPLSLRLALVAGFRGLEGAFTSGGATPFGTLLLAGIEAQPKSSAWSQLRLGLRGGWLLAHDDQGGSGGCPDKGASSPAACTRPVVQAVAGYAVLERFRIQLVGEWLPAIAHRKDAWSVAPGIGLELGF